MNISPFLIYLWGQADQLISVLTSGFFVVVMVLSLIGFIISTVVPESEWGSPKHQHDTKKLLSRVGLIALVVYSLGTFIPSSKTVALMYVIPTIANSATVQKDLPEIYDAAMKALKANLNIVPEGTKAEAKN